MSAVHFSINPRSPLCLNDLWVQHPGAGAGAGQHAALRRHGLPPLQLPRHGRQHPRGEHTKYLTPRTQKLQLHFMYGNIFLHFIPFFNILIN